MRSPDAFPLPLVAFVAGGRAAEFDEGMRANLPPSAGAASLRPPHRRMAEAAAGDSWMPQPLPESILPYAERMFAWFPEVLVSLGSPGLHDSFMLPPAPGAQLRLEETFEHKFVQVRLCRRASSTARKAPVPTTLSGRCSASAGVGCTGVGGGGSLSAGGSSSSCRSVSGPAASVAASCGGGGCVGVGVGNVASSVAAAGHHHSWEAADRSGGDVTSVPGGAVLLAVSPPSDAATSATGAVAGSRDGDHEDASWRPSRVDSSGGSASSGSHGSRREREGVRFEPEFVLCEGTAQGAGGGGGSAPAAVTAGAAASDCQASSLSVTQRSGDVPPKPSRMRPPTPPMQPGAQSPRDVPALTLPTSATSATGILGPRVPPRFASLGVAIPSSEEDTDDGSNGAKEAMASGADSAPESSEAEVLLPPLPPKTCSAPAMPATPLAQRSLSDGAADVVTPLGRAPPLVKRRGLAIEISDDWRRSSKGDEAGDKASRLSNESNQTPKVIPPAVLLRPNDTAKSVQTPKGLLQPLPGAFPNYRTLIFFDWDDTLCPTSWIRRILTEHMSDQWRWIAGEACAEVDWRYTIPAWFGQPLPDHPHIRESIRLLQQAVIDLICVAQTLGVVVIVTNAVDGWVDKTTKKWLPSLKQYIRGHGARPPIAVLYGQRLYKRPSRGSRAATLDWIDEYGELTWWKKDAMIDALERVDDLYRLHTPKSPRATAAQAAAVAAVASAAMSTATGTGTEDADGAEASSASNATTPQPLACGTGGTGGGSGSGDEEPDAPGLLVNPRVADVLPVPPWQADRGAKAIASVLSIGDSEAEMQATQLALLAHGAAHSCALGAAHPSFPPSPSCNGTASSRTSPFPTAQEVAASEARPRRRPLSTPVVGRTPKTPWVKNLKLLEGPSVEQMIEQLILLRKVLPQVVATRSHLRFGVAELEALVASGVAAGSGEEPDARLDRLLRTQTV